MKATACCLVVFATLSQAACSLLDSNSTPVPLASALAITERDLRAASPVVLADVGTEREEAIVSAIQAAQCVEPRTANPFVPVMTGPVSLALQGQIQAQSSLTGGAPLGFTFQVTRSKQQQVTVPVTFVSATGLPDFYMGQQLTELANLDAGSKDATSEGPTVSARKSKLVAEILDRRDGLVKLVDKAKKDYGTTIAHCKADKYGVYGPPFIPQLQ